MRNSWEPIYKAHRHQQAILHSAVKWWEPLPTIISNPYDNGPISIDALPGQWTDEQLWDYRDRVDMSGRVRKRRHAE